MDISYRNYPQSFQAGLIPINKTAEDSVSRALRGHFRKAVRENLDIFDGIYPKTIVTLSVNNSENGTTLVAKNTTNCEKLKETITGEYESGNAFVKLLSRLVEQKDNPEYNIFWNGARKEF